MPRKIPRVSVRKSRTWLTMYVPGVTVVSGPASHSAGRYVNAPLMIASQAQTAPANALPAEDIQPFFRGRANPLGVANAASDQSTLYAGRELTLGAIHVWSVKTFAPLEKDLTPFLALGVQGAGAGYDRSTITGLQSLPGFMSNQQTGAFPYVFPFVPQGLNGSDATGHAVYVCQGSSKNKRKMSLGEALYASFPVPNADDNTDIEVPPVLIRALILT